MKDECEENLVLTVGIIIGALVMLIVLTTVYKYTDEKDLQCREGKLYEVTHEGNITIYDPTFDECEETK